MHTHFCHSNDMKSDNLKDQEIVNIIMVKIQEYTNTCVMLQYKVFTIETPELQSVKVNFTLEEAKKLYSSLNWVLTGGGLVNATPRPLYSRERPGTHCIGGWLRPSSGLDTCGKSRSHHDSIPVPSSP